MAFADTFSLPLLGWIFTPLVPLLGGDRGGLLIHRRIDEPDHYGFASKVAV